MNHRISAKAFIIKDGKILLAKRKKGEEHWEPIGGKLEEGEEIIEGLKREVKEEVGIEIKPIFPIKVHHFIRKSGAKTHMVTFLCKYKEGEIKINEEEVKEVKWVKIEEATKYLNFKYWEDIGIILTWMKDII